MTGKPDLHDPDLEALLSAYLDGELSAKERQTVELHLASCNRCRELLADLERVKYLVAALPLESPPRPVILPRRPVRRLVELAALAAVLAGLFLIGADALLPQPAPQPMTPAAQLAPAQPSGSAERTVTRPEPALSSGNQPTGVRVPALIGAGLAVSGTAAFLAVRFGRVGLLLGLVGLAGGLLGGCAGTGGGQSAEPPVPPEAERIVAAVRADAARRLGQDPARVRVVSLEAVDWPDTSLGCPEQGKFYAQVITPGYRVVVRAGNTDYEYHTDRAGNFVLCIRGQPSAR